MFVRIIFFTLFLTIIPHLCVNQNTCDFYWSINEHFTFSLYIFLRALNNQSIITRYKHRFQAMKIVFKRPIIISFIIERENSIISLNKHENDASDNLNVREYKIMQGKRPCLFCFVLLLFVCLFVCLFVLVKRQSVLYLHLNYFRNHRCRTTINLKVSSVVSLH